MISKIKNTIEKWIPKISLSIVTLAPIFDWIINYIEAGTLELKNPYTAWDFNLILIFCVLNLIYDKLNNGKNSVGDESSILMNRNQSDYYEIWEECKKKRSITIDAYGHSFKTLWYNFIKKFLNEVIININHYDYIKIQLISTKANNCFDDIIDFYNSLSPSVAKKIEINLVKVEEMTFFTGICVNKESLWLSIREPHQIEKMNEHVREWRRKNNETSAKIIDWFLGIIDYYILKSPCSNLSYSD